MRSDLLKTFHRLFADDSFARLDWVVIETTGLADPAPLIQSLYMDEQCRDRLRMDCVLTVVDAKHFPRHLNAPRQTTAAAAAGTTASMGAHGGISEAVLQVTFADRVILNKMDLVSPAEAQGVMRHIAGINPSAQVLACEHGQIPVTDLLNVRAFDPHQNKALLALDCADSAVVASAPILIRRDGSGKILRQKVMVDFGSRTADKNAPADTGISTVSLTCEESLDLHAFNRWISALLKTQGEAIFRSKGILSMRGHDQQFVAQGVHMIFDGERAAPWPPGPRRSRLVLIGRDLDHSQLRSDFLACRATQQ